MYKFSKSLLISAGALLLSGCILPVVEHHVYSPEVKVRICNIQGVALPEATVADAKGNLCVTDDDGRFHFDAIGEWNFYFMVALPSASICIPPKPELLSEVHELWNNRFSLRVQSTSSNIDIKIDIIKSGESFSAYCIDNHDCNPLADFLRTAPAGRIASASGTETVLEFISARSDELGAQFPSSASDWDRFLDSYAYDEATGSYVSVYTFSIAEAAKVIPARRASLISTENKRSSLITTDRVMVLLTPEMAKLYDNL